MLCTAFYVRKSAKTTRENSHDDHNTATCDAIKQTICSLNHHKHVKGNFLELLFYGDTLT